ncbi:MULTISPECIES: Dph6-related ATP pyrophosphatase [Aestuariibaculum]|uniref:Diphthine--ammonia ligase n=1 Tax=Aestuariibaculum lutulentum TaxID=2920935 RepID=A0ABS9RHQ1_9FLAO|nr:MULTISPECIES: diphthine--ammonia ligase [Aestuariibaculum]MCH4552481.1 diphthine--ammonia ligase [Aestuariibaculum lutulentum]MCR8668597.1 diphthine--ammonia ligase [Aestuariibaculum sp. M13]
MNKHKTYFNWSSGKDSALALYHLLQDEQYTVDELITTINTHYNRVSMHGLRKELLEAQTQSIGIKSSFIELPEMPDMVTYEMKMLETVVRLKTEGFTHTAFGDIFLEDLKAYREAQLAKQNISAVFPIWKRDTKELMHEFLDLGFKTIIVCANSKFFNEDFVGTVIDKNFIDNLPEGVDPCGENGEFHTFCFDGPIFKNPIEFKIGEKVYREYDNPNTDNSVCESDKYGVWYCDLIPN